MRFLQGVPLLAIVANLIPLLHFHFAKVFRERGYELSEGSYALMAAGYFSLVVFFFIDFAHEEKIRYSDLIAATAVYAVLLFVIASEILIRGGAAYLTRWRGEQWSKELDYVYLTLGAIGLVISTNRLEIVDQRLTLPEFIGPFVLATALVVRTIKTRVEINNWNRISTAE